jgi:hypothetical protein
MITLLLFFFLALGISESVFAVCTQEQKQKLLSKGISESEVADICGQASTLPSWLSGVWRVDAKPESTNVPSPMGFGPTSEVYRMQVQGDTLAIALVRDHLLGQNYQQSKPLQVSNVAYSGNELRFSVRDPSRGSSTEYTLAISGDDEMHGHYQEVTRGEFGLPPIRFGGSVAFIKQQEINY